MSLWGSHTEKENQTCCDICILLFVTVGMYVWVRGRKRKERKTKGDMHALCSNRSTQLSFLPFYLDPSLQCNVQKTVSFLEMVPQHSESQILFCATKHGNADTQREEKAKLRYFSWCVRVKHCSTKLNVQTALCFYPNHFGLPSLFSLHSIHWLASCYLATLQKLRCSCIFSCAGQSVHKCIILKGALQP